MISDLRFQIFDFRFKMSGVGASVHFPRRKSGSEPLSHLVSSSIHHSSFQISDLRFQMSDFVEFIRLSFISYPLSNFNHISHIRTYKFITHQFINSSSHQLIISSLLISSGYLSSLIPHPTCYSLLDTCYYSPHSSFYHVIHLVWRTWHFFAFHLALIHFHHLIKLSLIPYLNLTI